MADMTNQAWNRFTMQTEEQDLISPNFKLYELLKSEIAARNNINNFFEEIDHLQAAVYLCRNILQRVRDEFGPFSPNSVYRCQNLERTLKQKGNDWISTSQHTLGRACDIEVTGMPTIELAKWASENLEYDQIICECYNAVKGVNSGWVHISIVPQDMGQNRHNLLSYVMDDRTGSYTYVQGLLESVK